MGQQDVALRAKAVLAYAEGLANVKVAKQLGTTPAAVRKWRKRFVRGGVYSLFDAPRGGAPARS